MVVMMMMMMMMMMMIIKEFLVSSHIASRSSIKQEKFTYFDVSDEWPN